ncbi:glutathione S-transferase family protein [Tropicimonas sp. IMCC34043]|uniref:glutathione S-transferase family protein n=1 Tax=Tropicimonas sp. IMCC34043 TaxID=2248760 RepID=UPI001E3B7FA9|nr:glutathione S-transferase family protein [Tropicimonas sp. IMCC34043]
MPGLVGRGCRAGQNELKRKLSMELTIYGRRDSSNCAKVFWLLDLIGQPFRLMPAGRGSGAENAGDFHNLTPFGKVPVMTRGDLVLWESNAILRYLASEGPSGAHWPSDNDGKARIDRWMDWVSLSLTPPLGALRKAKDDERLSKLPAVSALAAKLESLLANTHYLAGDCVTLADICAGPAVHRLGLLADLLPLADLPNLSAYRSRMEADPLYAAHIRDRLS